VIKCPHLCFLSNQAGSCFLSRQLLRPARVYTGKNSSAFIALTISGGGGGSLSWGGPPVSAVPIILIIITVVIGIYLFKSN
jgi:hypothetical protein